MKTKIIFLLFCIIANICYSQDMKVDNLKLAQNDLSASINKVLDNNGRSCALLKIWTMEDIVKIEGNTIGSIKSKGVEKSIYLTSGTKEIRIIPKNFLPVHIVFKDHNIESLEGERTYILRLIVNKSSIPANKEEITTVEYNAKDLTTMAFGQIPTFNLNNDTETLYETLKVSGLNPNKDSYGVSILYCLDPAKCQGINAVKRRFKLTGCETMPESVSMGYETSILSEGRITYNFNFPHLNDSEKRRTAIEQSEKFAKALFNAIKETGIALEGNYNNAEGYNQWGKISIVYNDNYGQCWVGLYIDNYYKKE